ncbi:hypothetical protein NDU88_002023 [Pleurodeles waltl]|uniref:Uncharacterized protein n=1 Tax=Pleurodeles waltl TaxID=8319 RepID=A0AAV7UVV9_PLEWA|nr:hypothetical protein NDU88_002023 [Pleurodeles waltl]
MENRQEPDLKTGKNTRCKGGCDGPEWVGPHYVLAGAGAAPANPDVATYSTNHGASRHRWQENGPFKSQPSRDEGRESGERRKNGRKPAAETTGTEEDGRGLKETTGGSCVFMEQSAPCLDGK